MEAIRVSLSNKGRFDYGVNMVVESMVTMLLRQLKTIDQFQVANRTGVKLRGVLNRDFDSVKDYVNDPVRCAQHLTARTLAAVQPEYVNLELAQALTKMIGGRWDEVYYLTIIDTVTNGTWDAMEDTEVNIELLAVVSGLLEAGLVLKELSELIGTGNEIPPIYTEGRIEFIQANMQQRYEMERVLFWKLLDDYLDMSFKSNLERDWYLDNDRAELELILKSVPIGHDWSYIAQRLGATSTVVEAAYQKRNDFLLQNVGQDYRSIDVSGRRSLAILRAVQNYLIVTTKKLVKADVEELVDPYTANLALVDDYHKNLEKAYEVLHRNFLGPDLDTFKGVFIPGMYVGPIRILEHATLAEISYFISEIKVKLRGQPWQHVSNCFTYKGKRVTQTQLQKPGAKPNAPAQEKLDLAVKIIKDL